MKKSKNDIKIMLSVLCAILILLSLVGFALSLTINELNPLLSIFLSFPFIAFGVCAVHELAHLFACLLTNTEITHVCIYPFLLYKNIGFSPDLTNCVSFKTNSKRKSIFIYLSGLIVTILLEMGVAVFLWTDFKWFYFDCFFSNALLLFGILTNRNGDLKKIIEKLQK